MKPLATLLLAAAAALAQPAAPTLPKIKFTDTRLENGLRVIISEDHYAPVYAICVAYKVGSKDERKGRTGFAHLFEHMMFKGSENVGPGELDFLIYTNGGNSNGTTNTDRTSYYEVLPKNQLDLGLFLEADRMRGLVITKENLENQRQAVKEERRLRVDNQAYGQTSEKMEELVYDNFAYHHSVIGSMEDLDAASVDDVKQFFKTYYAPNNAVLALVGDLDTKETLAKVKKYFGSIPRQDAPEAGGPDRSRRRAPSAAPKLDDPLARLTRIDIAYRIPPAGTADTRALAIAASILGGGGGGFGGRGGGGGNNSRLYQKLVRRRKLATQVSAASPTGARARACSTSPPRVRPGKTPEEVEGLISRRDREAVFGAGDGEGTGARADERAAQRGESRMTALSRAQALADAAAVYDDPEPGQHASSSSNSR